MGAEGELGAGGKMGNNWDNYNRITIKRLKNKIYSPQTLFLVLLFSKTTCFLCGKWELGSLEL